MQNMRSRAPRPKPHHFWDSDVGKWIEATGYSLASYPDPELERQVDEVADLIEKAQQVDGYLNTSLLPSSRTTAGGTCETCTSCIVLDI